MPIYEYKCQACGHQFEKIVKLNETPDCESCKNSNLEKIFSVPGIRTPKSQQRAAQQEEHSKNKVRRERVVAQREYERREIDEHR